MNLGLSFLTFNLAALSLEGAIVPGLRCGEVKHGVAQEPVGFRPVASDLGFEPRDYVGIQVRIVTGFFAGR